MNTIDSSIRTAAYQPGAGDEAALAPKGKKLAKNDIGLETAALSQAMATRTMSSINAFQNIGAQMGNAAAASPAAQAQLGSELGAAAANQPVDIYAIMGLVQQSAQEMRNANREIRASELNAEVGELISSTNDLAVASNFRLAAGLVQSGVQMASSGIQAYGSISAAAKSAQAAGPQGKATELKDGAQKMNDSAQKFSTQAQDLRTQASVAKSSRSVTKLQTQAQAADDKASNLRSNARSMGKLAGTHQANVDELNASGQNISNNAGITGKMLGAGGDMLTSFLKYAADSADISSKRHEVRAKLHASNSAAANDMMQQMMDVIRDVKDKLSSIDQSRIETNRGIARNI